MSQVATLSLGAAHLAIVTGILRRHLPPGSGAWVFGSRAQGRAKPYSDIDILIDIGRRLDLDTTIALADEFDESDLPYKVDIVDRQSITPQFRAIIEGQPMVALSFAPAT